MSRFFLVTLIVLILGILETTVASYPLLFLWMLCFSMVNKEKQSFWLAFLSGLWLDFLKGGVLGETALVFLIFSLLVVLYKRKFKVIHPLYFFPFVLISVLVFEFWDSSPPAGGLRQGFGGIGEIWGIKVFWSLLVAAILFRLAQVLKSEGKSKLNL